MTSRTLVRYDPPFSGLARSQGPGNFLYSVNCYYVIIRGSLTNQWPQFSEITCLLYANSKKMNAHIQPRSQGLLGHGRGEERRPWERG